MAYDSLEKFDNANKHLDFVKIFLIEKHSSKIKSVLSQKICGKIIDLSYTRGVYDVVAIVEAPTLDIMTSLKLSMMKTGALSELIILEDIDLNTIAKEGTKMIGLYKALGN